MSNDVTIKPDDKVLPPSGDVVSFPEFKEWFESLGCGPIGNAREVSFHPLGVHYEGGVMMRVERYAVNELGHRFFSLVGSPAAPRSNEPTREVVWVPLRRLPG